MNRLLAPFTKIRVQKKINKFLGQKLLPFLLLGKTLEDPRPYLLGNNSKHLIVLDSVEFESIKLILPFMKVYWAKHPRHGAFNNVSKARNKLLVLVGGPMGTISDHNLARWVEVVEKVQQLSHPTEICVRNHPREKESLKMRFEDAFRARNIQITTINSAESSIVKGFGEYMGVIGSPSSALKFARTASQEIFVIGLTGTLSSAFFDDPRCLGDTEGIHWFREGDMFEDHFVKPPKLATIEKP